MTTRLYALLTAVLLLLAPLVAHAKDPAWWDTDYGYRLRLTLGPAGISANQNNFPLMVEIDGSRVDYGTFASSTGDDVRFVRQKSDGSFQTLTYEIERFDTSGTSVFWVKLPTLRKSAVSAGEIWMYWGNVSAVSVADPSGTWKNAYKAVWHFDGLNDSTSTGADLTAHGSPSTVAAAVGQGRQLHGSASDDYFEASSVDFQPWLGNEANASVEFWIQTTQTGGSTGHVSPGLMGVNQAGQDDVFWGWMDNTLGTSKVGLQLGDGSSARVSVGDGNWHFIVLRYKSAGDKVSASIDGTAFLSDTGSHNYNKDQVPAFNDIGRVANTGDPYLAATIDEVRILSTAADDDYAAADYASQHDDLIAWCTSNGDTFYADTDGDGYGNPSVSIAACAQPYGYVANSDDCDDSDATINPDTQWYLDGDNDGYGLKNSSVVATQCAEPNTGGLDYAPNDTDCDDTDTNNWASCGSCTDHDHDGAYVGCDRYQTITEDCDDNDARAWDTCGTCGDQDGDGWYTGCNAYPTNGAADACDDPAQALDAYNWTSSGCGSCADNDGDGHYSQCDSYDATNLPEDKCDDPSSTSDPYNWTGGKCGSCADNDGDGHYTQCDSYDVTNLPEDKCDDPTKTIDPYNWTQTSCGSCDDPDGDGHYSQCDSYDTTNLPEDLCEQNDSDHVGAHQWNACSACMDADTDHYYVGCDAFDSGFVEDCDDNDAAVNPATIWYVDSDHDGEGSGTKYSNTAQCADPSTTCGNAVPPLTETCYAPNHDDCDDSDPILNSRTTWYKDADYDGAGDPAHSTHQCADPSQASCTDTAPGGNCYVRNADDCDDGDPAVQMITWYLDGDHDTYGSEVPTDTKDQCAQPTGYVGASNDCDDTRGDVHPDAPETCGDGVDSNCDGSGGPNDSDDADGISWADENAVGANDCSMDSDGDHVPDDIEWGDTSTHTPMDTDNDDTPDIVDPDDDGDGVPTVAEDYSDGAGGAADGDPTNDDTDQDLIPDYLDPDDDGDTIATIDEDLDGNGDPRDDDYDVDLVPNYLDADDDNDRIPTAWEEAVGADPYNQDSDFDSVSDKIEWGTEPYSETPRDSDGDGTPDVLDTDDDNDGILTLDESPDDLDGDADCYVVGDGLPSYRDIDSDGDGFCDGTYVPQGDECTAWSGVIRDTANSAEIPELVGVDYDNDGLDNVYDCDDLDFGTRDTDRDGLSNSEEHSVPCYTDDQSTVHCLDPARRDTDGDGVSDGLEVGSDLAHPMDTDNDGIPDWWDTDDDGDHVLTIDEDYSDGLGGEADGDPTNDDTDRDNTPDYLDPDDDGDGMLTKDEDWNEDGDPRNDDINGDGLADYLDPDPEVRPTGDLDSDGVTNEDEAQGGADMLNPDTDGDGVLDGLEWADADGNRLDSDGDEILDVNDTDDDGDGIPTAIEGASDVDGDGVPNYLDEDSDGDGVTDATEGGEAYQAGDPLPDTDHDGIPDFLDPRDDVFDTGGTTPPPRVLPKPGCACDSVPAPASGLGLLVLLGLAGIWRRRRDEGDAG